MSFLASEWASEAAPVADTYERVVLMILAYRADDDGCGAHPSIPSMARSAICDTETIKRRLRSLQKRGLIALGDQSLVRHYRRDRRPKVYDLLIPYDWYSAQQISKINRQREERGLPALESRDRPAIAAAPKKSGRTDRGVPNPKRSPKRSTKTGTSPTAADNTTGALTAPPFEPGENGHEGSEGAVDGGSLSRPTGALREPQTNPLTKPVHKPTNHASNTKAATVIEPTPDNDLGWLVERSNGNTTSPGTQLLRSLRSADGGQLAAHAVRKWAPFVDVLLKTTNPRDLADQLSGNVEKAGGIVYRLKNLHELESQKPPRPLRPPRPAHCGHPECNEQSRFREPELGPGRRCPDCHPDPDCHNAVWAKRKTTASALPMIGQRI